MANPETLNHLDDKKPQLKVERKEAGRKPSNIEWQNDEVKNIESENADFELIYQTTLLNLRESFPGIPEDLTNKKIMIFKWRDFISINGRSGEIDVRSMDGDKWWFWLLKKKDWTYLGHKWHYEKRENKSVYINEKLEPSEFENEISKFTNSPNLCNIKTRVLE